MLDLKITRSGDQTFFHRSSMYIFMAEIILIFDRQVPFYSSVKNAMLSGPHARRMYLYTLYSRLPCNSILQNILRT